MSIPQLLSSNVKVEDDNRPHKHAINVYSLR